MEGVIRCSAAILNWPTQPAIILCGSVTRPCWFKTNMTGEPSYKNHVYIFNYNFNVKVKNWNNFYKDHPTVCTVSEVRFRFLPKVCDIVSLSPHLSVCLSNLERIVGEELGNADRQTDTQPTQSQPSPCLKDFNGLLWQDSWSWRLPAVVAGKPLGESWNHTACKRSTQP